MQIIYGIVSYGRPKDTFGWTVCEGDRKAEAEVDERLLIPFRHFFRWNIDNVQSLSSDKHYDSVAMDITQVLSVIKA